MDETIEHTAKAMLGLTFNCAKCHDHKYDPFSQVEYYRMRPVFKPYQIRTEMMPGGWTLRRTASRGCLTPISMCSPTCTCEATIRIRTRAVRWNQLSAFLSSDELKLVIHPVSLPIEAVHPGLRESVVTTHRRAAEQQITVARSAVQAARDKLIEIELATKELTENELAVAQKAVQSADASCWPQSRRRAAGRSSPISRHDPEAVHRKTLQPLTPLRQPLPNPNASSRLPVLMKN